MRINNNGNGHSSESKNGLGVLSKTGGGNGGTPLRAKIDLHCHSYASDQPSFWLMKAVGCPESFTSPHALYQTAVKNGMDFVTITDHNSIRGVKEIADRKNVIVGNEITAFFPDRVKVDVNCFGFSEEEFEDIQELRLDLYELIRYLNERGIFHYINHPLYSVNNRLTWSHFERLLLLFKHFEILNGSRLQRNNSAVASVIQHIDRQIIENLADKYNIQPVGPEPWIKYPVGGSDDHSGLFIGTCYTEVEIEQPSTAALLQGLKSGLTKAIGSNDGFLTLAHQAKSIAYQFYRTRTDSEHLDFFILLNRLFDRDRKEKLKPRAVINKALQKMTKPFIKPKGARYNVIEEIKEIVKSNQDSKTIFTKGQLTKDEYNERLFHLTAKFFDRLLINVIEKPKIATHFLTFSPFLTLPYTFTVWDLHKERNLCRQALEFAGIRKPARIGWFTDSFLNMDGVSRTCQSYHNASLKRDFDLEFIVSTDDKKVLDFKRAVNFEPIKSFALPQYEQIRVYLPSLLQMLRYIEKRDYDQIIVGTPGPVGIIGLIAAKLMRIPVHGIYHTDFGHIVYHLTDDPALKDVVDSAAAAFYRNFESVFAPSKWYVQELIDMGLEENRIRILERWVDIKKFSPRYRQEDYWSTKKKYKLLFVGRISKDKNIDTLIEAAHELRKRRKDFDVYIVGKGPDEKRLRKQLTDCKYIHLTGPKYGSDLSIAYASSDIFVFPSKTDTFGNVVIEAQASGLPCLVSHSGGPRELITNQTGMALLKKDDYVEALDSILSDEIRLQTMKRMARKHVLDHYIEPIVYEQFIQGLNLQSTDDRPSQPVLNEIAENEPVLFAQEAEFESVGSLEPAGISL